MCSPSVSQIRREEVSGLSERCCWKRSYNALWSSHFPRCVPGQGSGSEHRARAKARVPVHTWWLGARQIRRGFLPWCTRGLLRASRYSCAPSTPRGLAANPSFQSILLHSGSTVQTLGNTGVYHTKPYVQTENPLGTSMWAHRGPLPGHLHSSGARHMHAQCWPCGDTGKYEMGLLPPRAFYLVERIQLIHVKCFKQLYHVQCTRLPPGSRQLPTDLSRPVRVEDETRVSLGLPTKDQAF